MIVFQDFLFYLFSSITIISALMVITSRHPVHAVLFLILAFFNTAGLIVLLGAEFLAMLLVVVYVGAVAVLFLFVVMMLDVDITAMRQGFTKFLPLGLFVAVILIIELFFALNSWVNDDIVISAITKTPDISNTKALGNVIYTHHFLSFQIAGIILLVAMIGAITLTLRTRDGVKKQVVSVQNERTASDAIAIKTDVNIGSGVNINGTSD